MGLCSNYDIFQEKMNKFFSSLECIIAHIDDLLIISNRNLANHIKKVKIVLKKIKAAAFKINAKSGFSSEIT